MREISFRVWDTEYKQWLKDREYSLENNNHLSLYNCVAEFVDTFYCGADDSRFIIQQFTGLKDIDGKEIYEGDIVEWQDSIRNTISRQETHREEITFSHGVFWASLPLYEINKLCKVIGNIFEDEKLNNTLYIKDKINLHLKSDIYRKIENKVSFLVMTRVMNQTLYKNSNYGYHIRAFMDYPDSKKNDPNNI
jgi:hypothetical protein